MELAVDYWGFQDDALTGGIIDDRFALIGADYGYADISEISNPLAPVFIDDPYLDGEGLSVDGWENYGLMTWGSDGFIVLELSDENVQELFISEFEADYGALEGNLAYLATNGEFTIFKVASIDFDDGGPPAILDVNDSIADGEEPDSIKHHRFTLVETTEVYIETRSEEYFDSEIFLYQVNGEELDFIDSNDNANGRLSALAVTLEPGVYDVAVAYRGSNSEEAKGTVNTYRWASDATYRLLVSEFEEPILSNLSFEGIATSVKVAGDYAYVNTENHGIYVIDIQEPYDPYVAGRYNFTGYSRFDEDRNIAADEDRLVLFDPYEGIVVIDPTVDLLVTGRTSIGNGVEYQLAWTDDRGQIAPQVHCAVVVGECTVTSVDMGNRTATVVWMPSDYSGTYGIMFALGNSNSFVSTRARLNWQGALGENPQPLAIEVDRFYGVLPANGLYGSVQHRLLSIGSSAGYRYEATSNGFTPEIYVQQYEAPRYWWQRGSWQFIDDYNGSDSVFEGFLEGGVDSQLSIGSSPLNSVDADRIDNINYNEGPEFSDGLYEIRGYRFPDAPEPEPAGE